MNLRTALQNPRNRKRKANCLYWLFPLLILACLNSPRGARGDVTLPHIFGSNMVLQREKPLFVWGWAGPGEAVTVKFAGQERTAVSDDKGRWQLSLKPLAASSEAAQMSISGSNSLVLTNILVGEVWLCSGQSNMEKPIGEQRGQKPVRNFTAELKTGDQYPEIRLFKADRVVASTPAKDVKGSWQVCSSNSLETMKFSAVGYFFARELAPHIKVPIGLIESSWGGTRIEPWIPAEGFKLVPQLDALTSGTNKVANTTPMAIFNGMVAPLVPYAMRGALWYQGESNCADPTNAPSYTQKMEGLIKGWRAVWREGDFPFYYVQIAPYHYYERPSRRVPRQDALPELWEAQTAALKVPRTGMVVITDLVDDLMDIHPTQKVEVGQRLARIALANDYGEREVIHSGPTFKRLKVRQNKALVYFDNVDGGLVNQDGKPLNWFSIAGKDGVFVSAEASISGDTVVVSSPEVSQPKAVRFAWNEAAQPNLFNKAGLPARPFRTGQ